MNPYTQFPSARSIEICDVVVGFDFGTSSSKVVLRTPFHNDSQAFAVPFGEAGHPSCRYLLPSVLSVSGGSVEASLVRRQGDLLLRDIKYHLMRGEDVPAVPRDACNSGCPAAAAAVAFMAMALREARRWFLENHAAIYDRYALRWSMNVGLPSEDFSDEKLCATYQKLSEAAWRLSVDERPVTIVMAEEVLASEDAWGDLPEEQAAEVKLVPEVAAEVVGYARSNLRSEGLHMLIDVGATTLDVCGFILHESAGDDCYELLTADVEELGASVLYRYRVEGVHRAVTDHMAGLHDEYDPVSPMPDSAEQYAPCHEKVASAINTRDTSYRSDCLKRVWKSIIDLKTKRDPRSDRWQTDLPLFLSGGGSAMPFYADLVDQLSKDLSDFYEDCRGVRKLTLTKPENLRAEVNDQLYHRLAVAWGLSYPETDIGQVCRPGEIKDVEPRDTYKPPREFISKEMV